MEPIWLNKAVILATHSKLAAEFGGKSGLKDAALLEASLNRPMHKFYYDDNVSIYVLAASYAYGLIKNHPFVDGNKRIGLVAMELFLLINGVHIVASQVEKYTLVMSVAAGKISEAEIVLWLESHSNHTPA